MHSSSSDNDSDPMFPGPDQQTHPSGGGPLSISDLSPPSSQDAGPRFNVDPMDTGLGPGQGGSTSREPVTVANILFQGPEKAADPGYAWKNRKARDDFSRAMEQVLDKNFSLSRSGRLGFQDVTDCVSEEYGDPFDETNKGGR